MLNLNPMTRYFGYSNTRSFMPFMCRPASVILMQNDSLGKLGNITCSVLFWMLQWTLFKTTSCILTLSVDQNTPISGVVQNLNKFKVPFHPFGLKIVRYSKEIVIINFTCSSVYFFKFNTLSNLENINVK